METGKGENAAASERWADLAKRVTEKQVAFYKKIMEPDYGRLAFTEEMMACYPAGPDAARAMNAFIREQVKDFKEHVAARIKEYEEKGCIEGYPETLIDPDFLNRLITSK